MCSRADVGGLTAHRNTARTRRSTIDSIDGAHEEFGREYMRRQLTPLSRPSKGHWIARILKRTAAPAAEKGGLGTGDWHHQGRPKQQDSCDCRQTMPAMGLDADARQHRRLHGG